MSGPIRISRFLSIGLVLVGLGSCIDLIPVEPPALKPTAFHLIIQIQNGFGSLDPERVPVAITVTLNPGIDGRGRPHRVIDDTIRVWARSLSMPEVGPAGRRLLMDTLRLSSAEAWAGPIGLRPPTIDGVESPSASLDWRRVRKAGPDSLQVRLREPVELTLASAGNAEADAPREQRWSVSFQRRGLWFGFGEDGPVPSTIRIPRELLNQAGPGTFGVYLFVDQAGTVSPEGTDYLVDVAMHQSIYWVVSVAADGE